MLEKNFFKNQKRNLRELKLAIPVALSLFIAGCKEEKPKLGSEKIKDLIESSYRRVERVDSLDILKSEEIFNKFKEYKHEVEVDMGDFTALVNDRNLKIRYHIYGQSTERDFSNLGPVNNFSNVYEYVFEKDVLIIRWFEEVPDIGFSTELLAQGELSVDKETGAVMYFIASGPGDGFNKDAEYVLKEQGPKYDLTTGGRGPAKVYYKEGMAEEFTKERLEVFSEIENYLRNNQSAD